MKVVLKASLHIFWDGLTLNGPVETALPIVFHFSPLQSFPGSPERYSRLRPPLTEEPLLHGQTLVFPECRFILPAYEKIFPDHVTKRQLDFHDDSSRSIQRKDDAVADFQHADHPNLNTIP